MTQAPKLELVEATETAIAVEFTPASSESASYQLEWKEYPATWEQSKSTARVSTPSSKPKSMCSCEATNLNPGTTYCVRLTCTGCEPGPELIVDTEQVGCTPQPSKGCACVIL